MMIAWEMFKDWWKTTFGGGVDFFHPTAPGHGSVEYQK